MHFQKITPSKHITPKLHWMSQGYKKYPLTISDERAFLPITYKSFK